MVGESDHLIEPTACTLPSTDIQFVLESFMVVTVTSG